MWVKNFAIGLAITIILPFLVNYGVVTFSPNGEYYSLSESDYLAKQGIKNADNPKADKATVALEDDYKKGNDAFNRHLFYAAVPAGILFVAAGLLIPIPGIGSGFMYGGLLTLLTGFSANWSGLSVRVRFVSLIFALVLFIIIGWAKYKKKLPA